MEKSKKRKHDKKVKDKKEGFLLILTKHEKDYSHVYIIYECAYSALPAGTRMSVKRVYKTEICGDAYHNQQLQTV